MFLYENTQLLIVLFFFLSNSQNTIFVMIFTGNVNIPQVKYLKFVYFDLFIYITHLSYVKL